jgi:membrane associated rhomboid family serine protease
MILPIRTSITPRRTPYMNYGLIVVNVLIFLLTYWPHETSAGYETILRPWALQFQLIPARPYIWQFVSYAFLHGGFMHIFFNMFFLYLFGNNVNDKLGNIGYLCFYLAGAVFSGIGHTVIHFSSSIPTLGASGAVAAVTGAYLVLFPQTLITVFYFFFFIGMIEVPALYFIVLKMIIIDNVITRYTSQVAYDAHLAGYAYGIAAMLGMLGTRLISSSNFDLWAMIRQWNRRRQFRDVVSSGYDPYTGRTENKRIKVKEVKSPAEQQKDEKTKELRSEISKRITERNLPAAAGLYLELMNHDSNQILPKQHLLDIANQLAGDNKHAESAQAYEQFLSRYNNYEYAEQVELMLGILYCRYLNQPELAIKNLEAAAKKLTDPGQLKMCNDELDRLK